MSNTIENIMRLADAYATAVAQHGEAHDHVARDALQDALAQQGTPVAWVDTDKSVIVGVPRLFSDGSHGEIPLYTTAPAAQHLTDDQVHKAMHAINNASQGDMQPTFHEMKAALMAAFSVTGE